jgi:hypothetical protein
MVLCSLHYSSSLSLNSEWKTPIEPFLRGYPILQVLLRRRKVNKKYQIVAAYFSHASIRSSIRSSQLSQNVWSQPIQLSKTFTEYEVEQMHCSRLVTGLSSLRHNCTHTFATLLIFVFVSLHRGFLIAAGLQRSLVF